MALHLLLWGNSSPPNELLDGAIVVVDEIAFRVIVTIPARQVAVAENRNFAAVIDSPPQPFVTLGATPAPIAVVKELTAPIARILQPKIPVAVVIENTSAAETR